MKNFSQTIAAQNATSASFPAIRSPSIPTDAAIGPQTMFYQTIALTYGQKYPVQIKGDYVYIEGITFDLAAGSPIGSIFGNLSIKADTNQTPVVVGEPYREIRFPEKFNVLEFSANYGVGTVFVTFFAGFGAIRRDYEPRFINSNQGWIEPGVGGIAGINQAFSPNITLQACTNPATQRGRITKATFIRESTTCGDLTLFLFSKNFSQTQGANFTFLPTGLASWEYLGQIRFPTFVAGGAGSSCVCDVADLNIDIFSNARDPNGYANGTIYGCLVANAAIPFVPVANNWLNLTIQT